MSDIDDLPQDAEWVPQGGVDDPDAADDDQDDDEVEGEETEEESDDESLITDDLAEQPSTAVCALYRLPPEEHRTPRVLSEAETALLLAAHTEFITHHGSSLPPEETERFSQHNFAVQAARREIELGLAPYRVRRDVGRLKSGAVVTECISLADLDKPHLPPRDA